MFLLVKKTVICLDKVFRTGRLRSASKEGGVPISQVIWDVTKENK